jgi:hypothetical protein
VRYPDGAANAVMRAVRDRMPVIVALGDFAAWFDTRTPPDQLYALL